MALSVKNVISVCSKEQEGDPQLFELEAVLVVVRAIAKAQEDHSRRAFKGLLSTLLPPAQKAPAHKQTT